MHLGSSASPARHKPLSRAPHGRLDQRPTRPPCPRATPPHRSEHPPMFGRFEAPDRTRVCRRNSECVPTLRIRSASFWEARAVLTFGYSRRSLVLAILFSRSPRRGLAWCAAGGKRGSSGDVATLPAACRMQTESAVRVASPANRAVGSPHPSCAYFDQPGHRARWQWSPRQSAPSLFSSMRTARPSLREPGVQQPSFEQRGAGDRE